MLKPILEFTVDDIRRIYAINVEATWDLVSRIGRTMPPGAAIVNLSSSSAKLATTTEAAVYASSKTAVLSITRSFAYAFAPNGVRVNAICPGIIDTPMQERVLVDVAAKRGMTVEELSTARNKTVPLGRSASADECAGAIWFLLSDEAGLHDGPGHQLHRWPGDVVSATRPSGRAGRSGRRQSFPETLTSHRDWKRY